jgi:hypothetical protein
MTNCRKYTVRIDYRAEEGSEREKLILDAAREYACDPKPHLIDRLLQDRHELFLLRAQKAEGIAVRERELAEEKRKLAGGGI